MPGHTPPYGFKVAGERTRRAYEVEERHMEVVRAIFRMVGVEGLGNRTVATRLNTEGFPTPLAPVKEKHKDRAWSWRQQFVRRCVLNDCYRPHTRQELEALVERGHMAPEVEAKAPEGCGVWWYEGRDFEGNTHRVAVPVPASCVEWEVANAARAAVIDNVPVSAAGGGRVWQLLGGIMRCGGCGLRMQAHAVRRKDRTYHYVRCPLNQRVGLERCPVNARMPAEAAEEAVWRFVTRLLAEPDKMVEDMDALIEAERVLLRGDPEQEMRGLRGRLRDLDGRRERAQDAYLAGAFTVEELRARQGELEAAREDLLRQMQHCEGRGERLRKLVAYRDLLSRRADAWNNLLAEHPDLPEYVIPWDKLPPELRERMTGPMPWDNDPFARAQVAALADATPEQRRERYASLELRVVAHSKEELEVSGLFRTEMIYTCNPSPRPQGTTTPSSASTWIGSSSRAAGSPRTWRASACETSPP